MKVMAFYANPTVLVTGADDPMALDLVAHFLGIAIHHNDNRAPPKSAAFKVISGSGNNQDRFVRHKARTEARWFLDLADLKAHKKNSTLAAEQ